MVVLYEIILSKHSTSLNKDGFDKKEAIELFTYEDLQLFYEIILKAIRDFYFVPDNKMSLMIPILQMISFRSNKEEKNPIKELPNIKEKKELKPITNNSTLMTLTKKITKEVDIEKNNNLDPKKRLIPINS